MADMHEPMVTEREGTSLWAMIRDAFRRELSRITGERRVTGLTDDGRLRTVSLDPNQPAEKVIWRLKGIPINPGDNVLTVRLPGGFEIGVGSILQSGEDALQDVVTELGDDGTSTAAARADHAHRGPQGNTSTQVGPGAQAIDRAIAIGPAAKAHDAAMAIGVNANAPGYISTAIGWTAQTEGEGAIAIGYAATASVNYSHAIGRNASAGGVGSIAIGRGTGAGGTRSITIGYNVVNNTNYTALIGANQLRVLRSDGTASVSSLALQDENGVLTNISIRADGRINVGGVWHAPGSMSAMFPPNKTVSSGASVNLRVGPGNAHAAIAPITVGGNVFDTGWRRTTDETWAYVFFHSYGWGWFPATRLVNL